MYGKWLYKEIGTEYGACMVEIYRKNYTGASIEIGALAADSLSIALENLGNITDPIGKSVCSFSIIDTNQVKYDDFFTPDATALKVVVSTRVGSGAYVTRWSGYITPDFFAENLSYRTPISISARDNIGYLNDVDFDLTATTVTVRELIQSAFTRIAEDYPMSLSFVSQKQTAEGILAIDATISTTLLREMSWGEALETILHDLGLQMRWVDNNTIAVLDLSQIPEYYATQGFNFVEASGYREIVPAWRQLSQEQDYGLRENFFEGWLREDNITFVKSVVMRPPNATNWTTDIAYYVPNNWGVARDIYTTDPSYYGTKFGKKIFFTGVSEEYPTTTYLSWRQQIQSSDVPMKMTFKAFNSVLYPSEKYTNLNTPSGRRLVAYNPKDAFHGQKVGEYLQIGLKMNVLLHSGLKTYILRSEWLEINDDGAGWQLDFTLPKVELSYVDGSQATAEEPREEEVTINIATIPYDGELELRIYGWYIVGKHNYWEDDYSVTDYTFDWLKCLSYINEPVFTFNTEDAETGQNSGIIINELHNVSKKEDYIFGEVPEDSGAINTYAGGLFKADGNEMVGFQRNADATNYNLLELVGREIIHFNKRNYNRLSGTIKNLSKEPLMFNRLFVREGKKYAPYNYSLNVISNKMNITSMQEVELYTTANFSEVHSEVSTGGSTVSSGNNQILQYSAEVGNAKRLYELQTISENEKPDAYVLVDGAGYPEARKLKLTDIAGLDKEALEQYLVQYKYLQEADLTPIIQDFEKLEEAVNPLFGYFDATGNANNALKLGGQLPSYYATADALNIVKNDVTAVSNRVQKFEDVIDIDKNGDVYIKGTRNFYTEGGTISMFGLSEGDSGEVASVSIKFEGSDDVYSAVEGIITLPAYPSGGGGVADSVAWSNVTGKPNTLGGYGITDALSVNGGELNGSIASTAFIFRDIATGNRGAIIQNINDNTWRLQNYWTGSDYIIIHSGNYSSYALPLSGGTIKGGSGVYSPLTITNTNLSEVWIRFNDEVGGCNIGSSNGVPSIYTGNGNQTIIHSGNIGSQSVNYASSAARLSLTWNIDCNVTSGDGVKIISNSSSNAGNYPYLYVSGLSVMSDYVGWQLVSYGGDMENPYFRSYQDNGTWKAWRQLAFLTDNVASATKLQTGRYFWGNYFNGESGVSGNPEYNYGGHLLFYNSAGTLQSAVYADNTLYLGMGYTNSSTIVMGGAVHLRYGSGTDGLVVNNQGNVLIGTTEDSGQKLKVAGSIVADRGNNGGVLIGGNGNTIDGYVNGSYAELHLNYSSTHNISLCRGGGNVGIGTTIPTAKLDVAGGRVLIFDSNRQSLNSTCITDSALLHLSSLAANNDGLFFGQIDNSTSWIQSAYYGTSANPSSNHTYPISLNPLGGNILIGTTEDNGCKLNVNLGSTSSYGVAKFSNNSHAGIYINSATNYNPFIQLQRNNSGIAEIGCSDYYNNLYIGSSSTDIGFLNINLSSGNVLIGTTIDSGYKLDVNGTVRVSSLSASLLMGQCQSWQQGNYPTIYSTAEEKWVMIMYPHIPRFQKNSGVYSSQIRMEGRDLSYWDIWLDDVWSVRYYENLLMSVDTAGNLVATGTIAMGTLSSSSDARLKDNIELLTEDESLAVLRQLRPSKWNWKSNGALSYGFIAQEVEEIASCMVDRMNDEELGQKLYLQYNQLHAFEVGAIQHIDSEVETLKRRVNELENELKQYRLCQ